MRKMTALATIAALAATVGIALADGDKRANRTEPASATMSVETVKSNIERLGYDIRAVKTDDGVFKVRMIDRASGGAVKAKYSAETGDLIRARPGS